MSGPGRADSFCGLAASFYSFKTKKIPARRVALGGWLGWVFLLVRELTTKDQGDSQQPWLGGSVSSRGDLGAGLCICGLGTRPRTCDLGIGLHKCERYCNG